MTFVPLRTMSALVNGLLQQRSQHFRLRFCLAHETKIIRVRAIHRCFAVVAEKVGAFKVVEIFHAGSELRKRPQRGAMVRCVPVCW